MRTARSGPTSSGRASPRCRRAPRCRRLHLRRGDGVARVLEGKRGFRGSSRRSSLRSTVSTASPRGEQRRDDGQHPWIITNAARRSPHWVKAARRGLVCSRWPGTCTTRGSTRSRWQDHLPGPDLRPGARGVSRRQDAQGLHPRRRLGPVFGPEHVDLPLGRRGGNPVDAGSAPWCHGLLHLRGAGRLRITKFFSRESCGQCTPCREGSVARTDHDRIRMAPDARKISICSWTLRQHLSRCLPRSRHHLRARPIHPLLHRLGHPHVRDESSCTSRMGGAPLLSPAPLRPRQISFTSMAHLAPSPASCSSRGRARRHLHPPLLLPPPHGAVACAACACRDGHTTRRDTAAVLLHAWPTHVSTPPREVKKAQDGGSNSSWPTTR